MEGAQKALGRGRVWKAVSANGYEKLSLNGGMLGVIFMRSG